MKRLRTQVGVVGSGPAGLLLGQLLHLQGIDSIVIEHRSSEHVINRVRAGVLEQGTVELLDEVGAGERCRREGMRHSGIHLRFEGRRHFIDLDELTGGRSITVYGQNEVVKDLIQARCQTGRPLYFDVENVAIADFESAPKISFQADGEECEISCDFIAGCDGFHGICRPAIPPGQLRIYDTEYPFGWLGILASAEPNSQVVYSLHERGFALFSMRTPSITRLYLQCAPDEDLSQWPDDRIWDELTTRLRTDDGWQPNRGAILQKGVTCMRGFVTEPMQYGRLFLAGDSAHIVPPTGAKGLNLAAADVRVLSRALAAYYRDGREDLLNNYSTQCLRRVWRVQCFSWWMTSMLHRAPGGNPYNYRRQLAELDYLTSSRAALLSMAENYVGMPME